MTGHVYARVCLLFVAAVAAIGCQGDYNTLRFRPVDTTSQLTLSEVKVLVGKPGQGGAVKGVTNEHGQVDVTNLKAGDVVTLVKEGYEIAVIKLGYGKYSQRSPASQVKAKEFSVGDGDAIPVPLHRTGQVRRNNDK